MNKFKIIIPTYNSDQWIENTIKSVIAQTYTDWKIIILDDASTDSTSEKVKPFVSDKVVYIRNLKNVGTLSNTINGITEISDDPEDIIVILDGDDWLYDEKVLSKLSTEYDGGILMTHGSYKHVSNGLEKVNYFEPPFDRTNRLHAVYHLRTFKRKLFDKINHEDLKENNKYFKVTGDMALLFPMIEMAGDKVKFITDVMYMYNDLNPLNDYKIKLQEQERVEMLIRNKQPYKRIYE